MPVYHDVSVRIYPEDPIYDYLDRLSQLANNLYNAALFRIRQVMTGVRKAEKDRQPNEIEVLTEIDNALKKMKPKFRKPSGDRWYLNYTFMDAYLRASKNPDYCHDELPAQSAQHILRVLDKSMKSFFESCRSYKKNPAGFLGMPRLPGYHTKGGRCTFFITNQSLKKKHISKLKDNIHGQKNGSPCRFIKGRTKGTDESFWYTFAKTKYVLPAFEYVPDTWKLHNVKVCPEHGTYLVHFSYIEKNHEPAAASESPKRICAIDLGIDNFASITNNVGLPNVLFKGKVIKSINRRFNMLYGKIQSEQTKDGTAKFHATPESEALCLWRKNHIHDFYHKTAKRILEWCLVNHIDTVVVGSNPLWKQNVNLGRKNNQKFVQIPFDLFKNMLSQLCSRNGIRFVLQEESYTSKASYRMRDVIPVYSENNKNEYEFSGSRSGRIYRDPDGIHINSDLNGSANIGRKAFPELFVGVKLYQGDILVVRHPDDLCKKPTHPERTDKPCEISKSKLKRLKKKQNVVQIMDMVS